MRVVIGYIILLTVGGFPVLLLQHKEKAQTGGVTEWSRAFQPWVIIGAYLSVSSFMMCFKMIETLSNPFDISTVKDDVYNIDALLTSADRGLFAQLRSLFDKDTRDTEDSDEDDETYEPAEIRTTILELHWQPMEVKTSENPKRIIE